MLYVAAAELVESRHVYKLPCFTDEVLYNAMQGFKTYISTTFPRELSKNLSHNGPYHDVSRAQLRGVCSLLGSAGDTATGCASTGKVSLACELYLYTVVKPCVVYNVMHRGCA